MVVLSPRLLLIVLFASFLFAVVESSSKKSGEEEEEEEEEEEDGDSFFSGVVGLAVLGIVITIICGIISLIAWLICCCHDKATKKRRTMHHDLVNSGNALRQPPRWAQSVVFLPEFTTGGFTRKSDGIELIDNCHVMRARRPHTFTDGAAWGVPLTSGKHTFEVVWSWSQRGLHSSVGVGTSSASLKVKGTKSLVGHDDQSWGFDITRRRMYHNGKAFGGIFPPDGSFVPDKFLMYVDLDSGLLGFGVDVTFWGFRLDNLPKDGSRPLFVMVGMDKWQAGVRVHYRGSADPTGMSTETAFMTNNMAPRGPVREPSLPPAYTEVAAPGPSNLFYPPPETPQTKKDLTAPTEHVPVTPMPGAPSEAALYPVHPSAPPPYSEGSPLPGY